MVKIDDKTTLHYKNLVEATLKPVFSVIPEEDFRGIEKIVLLNECPDQEFKWVGDFIFLARKIKVPLSNFILQ